MWHTLRNLITETVECFTAEDVMSKAAALALYSALGLSPMILLVVSLSRWMGPGTEEAIIHQAESFVGQQAAVEIREVVQSTKQQQQASSTLSALVGLAVVLFSASGIFAQLQSTLNDIWGVKPKPRGGFKTWLRARLLSIGTLISALFLLLVSLLVSTGVAMTIGQSGVVWHVLNLAISMLVDSVLFALVFKLLPDVKMQWRDVCFGAVLTAVLFTIGTYLIGLYLGRSAVASSYGAAGSLVALIVWVYYSAIIVFFGAEVTQVYARHYGSGIEPDEYAMRKEKPCGS